MTEVAKGIDVRRDILDQMVFAPVRIADPLPLMEASLFAESRDRRIVGHDDAKGRRIGISNNEALIGSASRKL